MSDAMMPFARVEADARYGLSRLAELLPLVGRYLMALGIETATAETLQAVAVQLGADIAFARETALRNQAREVPS